MADFIIQGDCDEAIARLKKTLEANDAAFNAKLAAMFKPAAKSSVRPEQAQPQQAKSLHAKSLHARPGSALAAPKKETSSLSRRPDGGGSGGSMRSRLRT